jgi:hypothetical protein
VKNIPGENKCEDNILLSKNFSLICIFIAQALQELILCKEYFAYFLSSPISELEIHKAFDIW